MSEKIRVAIQPSKTALDTYFPSASSNTFLLERNAEWRRGKRQEQPFAVSSQLKDITKWMVNFLLELAEAKQQNLEITNQFDPLTTVLATMTESEYEAWKTDDQVQRLFELTVFNVVSDQLGFD